MKEILEEIKIPLIVMLMFVATFNVLAGSLVFWSRYM